LLQGTLVGGEPVAVPEHGVVSIQGTLLPPEFPVEKIRFPDSSLAGPAPDIQIELKKKLVGELDCVSLSWFAGSAERVVPFKCHPKSQPREEPALKSQKLPKAA